MAKQLLFDEEARRALVLKWGTVDPDVLPAWVPLVQIGSSTDTFFLLQSNTLN